MQVHTNQSKSIGLGATLDQIIQTAYGSEGRNTIYLTQLPAGRYDYIANLPHGAFQALQEQIKRKFGVIGRWQPVETNVLLLKLAGSDDRAFKPAGSLMRSMNITNIESVMEAHFGGATVGDAHFYQTMASFISGLESTFQLPIVDDTGITNQFDCIYKASQSDRSWTGNTDALQKATRDALYNQLGLELVPGIAPVKMLVVEKTK